MLIPACSWRINEHAQSDLTAVAFCAARLRDKQAAGTLIQKQSQQKAHLETNKQRLEKLRAGRDKKLSGDVQQYKDIQTKKRDVADFKQRMQSRSFGGIDRER